MLPDRVSNPGPLAYESGALPIALRGPAHLEVSMETCKENGYSYMYEKAVSKGTLTVKGRRIERTLRAPIFEIYYNRR